MKPIKNWRKLPEIQLLLFALPLELLWEIAQFPLYTLWHEGTWVSIFYALMHCTLGDLMILLSAYWLVALFNKNRHWYQSHVLSNGIIFTLLGAGYTVYSEIVNVKIRGSWAYTEHMPIIPVMDIGAMPFFQWLLIPPVLLWLIRLTTPSTTQV